MLCADISMTLLPAQSTCTLSFCEYYYFEEAYKDCVANKEVHAKIQRAIGPHTDLLTIVKRCKLQWYGHISRSSGLATTILQGTVLSLIHI